MDSKGNSRWGWWEWFSWSLTLNLNPHRPKRGHCGPAMRVGYNDDYPGDDENEPLARLPWPGDHHVWEKLGGELPPQHQLIRTALRLHRVIITTITTINGCTQISKKQANKQTNATKKTGFDSRPIRFNKIVNLESQLTDWLTSLQECLVTQKKVKNAKKAKKQSRF